MPLFDPAHLRPVPHSVDLSKEALFPKPAASPAAGAFRRVPRTNHDAYERCSRVLDIVTSEERFDFSEEASLFTYQVPLKGLPMALERLSILFLSDIHLSRCAPHRANEVLALVNFFKSRKIQLDVVALGGDIIDVKRSDLCFDSLFALAALAPPGRRFAVLGNHDYYGKSEKLVRTCLAAAGFADIENSFRSISVEGSRINFFGLGEKREGRAQLHSSIAERQPEVNVLLTHTLDNVTRKVPDSFDLVLSGHFHGGEISLGPLNGVHFLRFRGFARDINRQIIGWDMLTNRALSYVSPGFARHARILSTCRPGAGLLQLRCRE